MQSRSLSDCFTILGFRHENVSHDDVKKRFWQLAKHTHPDTKRGAPSLFREICNAYQIILRERFSGPLHGASHRPIISAPPSRFLFPGNVTHLARNKTLHSKLSVKKGRWIIEKGFDLELPLYPEEFNRPMVLRVPVVSRALCPDCLGSDIHCPACDGRGSYRKTVTVRLFAEEGLTDGQIIQLRLDQLKPGTLSHFKKKSMRIKISAAK